MTMRCLRDTRGSGAAEFVLVLPLLLILLFGIIDGGRWLWTFNEAVKATQVGARVAVVTKVVPAGLATSYIGITPAGAAAPLTQGDLIPASALGKITCTKAASAVTCACSTAPCPTLGATSAIGWDAIVARMKGMLPSISDANVVIEYSGSGIGYAGDPDGQDISPLVTVKLTGLNFTPITFLMLKSVQAIPAAATTLTAEDQLGSQSN
jgi:hypothetical protein